MSKACPNCSTIHTEHALTCRRCGTELSVNGTMLDALTFWETGRSKLQRWPVGIMLGAVAVTIITKSLIPLAVGLLAAGIVYIRGYSSRDDLHE